MTTTAAHAATFRALHRPGTPLVLVNAWDAASARVFAAAGAPAIATSSAALAWSLGYADGQQLPLPLLVDSVARIARVIDVPLSVDLEQGYGVSPREVGAAVRQVAAAGGIGINIEDGGGDAGVLVAKIDAIRALGLPLFVNARCDVYLRGVGAPEGRLEEAVRRATRYVEAGADGVFVPALLDLDGLAHVVRAVPRPINALAWPGAPSVTTLAAAGVARVSVGCGPMQATLGLARRLATELLQAGTYGAMADGPLSVGEVNGLFAAP